MVEVGHQFEVAAVGLVVEGASAEEATVVAAGAMVEVMRHEDGVDFDLEVMAVVEALVSRHTSRLSQISSSHQFTAYSRKHGATDCRGSSKMGLKVLSHALHDEQLWLLGGHDLQATAKIWAHEALA